MDNKNQAPVLKSFHDQQVETNFNFGISLLKTLTLDQINSLSSVVLSPISMLCALSQLNLGAKNKTKEEITKIFGQGKNFIWLKWKQICNACPVAQPTDNNRSSVARLYAQGPKRPLSLPKTRKIKSFKKRGFF